MIVCISGADKSLNYKFLPYYFLFDEQSLRYHWPVYIFGEFILFFEKGDNFYLYYTQMKNNYYDDADYSLGSIALKIGRQSLNELQKPSIDRVKHKGRKHCSSQSKFI